MPQDPPTYLTTQEAADRLGFSAESLRRWDTNGKFPASHKTPGGIRLYLPADVDEFARSLNRVRVDQ